MERMSVYNTTNEFERTSEVEFRSLFERHTEISESELERVQFYPETGRLVIPKTPETAPERSVEALWHRDTQTLIVPPPQSGEQGVKALAKMSLPVVAFIDEIKPDIVIGCDRGGRLFSLATHSMWRNLHDRKKRFPTIDEKMRFAHLSRRFGPEVFADLVEDILQRSLKEQKHDQNGDKLTFLFIDDHVSTGATRRFSRAALDLIGLGPEEADMFFAISWGTQADVSGGRESIEEPWQNKPKMIGVEYNKDHIGRPVRAKEAKNIRVDLYKAIKKEARDLKAQRVARKLHQKTK